MGRYTVKGGGLRVCRLVAVSFGLVEMGRNTFTVTAEETVSCRAAGPPNNLHQISFFSSPHFIAQPQTTQGYPDTVNLFEGL